MMKSRIDDYYYLIRNKLISIDKIKFYSEKKTDLQFFYTQQI